MTTTYTQFKTLHLPAGALALRALRPTTQRYVRFVSAPLFQGLPYDSPLWQMRDVPVFVKHPRYASAAREAYLSH
jgi:hypothetical protein